MKKHKSVVAILLAVMMIFTMMPMMAFASTTQKVNDKTYTWADDFSTVDGYATVRTWNAGDGSVTAAFDSSGMSESIVNAYSDAVITYYDLDNAVVKMDGKDIYKNYSQTDFEKIYNKETKNWFNEEVDVLFKAPSYVAGYAGFTPAQKNATVPSEAFSAQWTAKLSAPEAYVSGSKEDQKFSLTTSLSTETENALFSKGSVPVIDITVKGVVTTPKNAKFYFDSTDGEKFTMNALNTTYYDGEAHAVVADEVTGWTVSYAVFNASTGKYDDVSAVSLTDVQKEDVRVKATWKQAGQTDVVKYFDVNLEAAYAPVITFDEEASITDAGYNYQVPGEDYTATDYIAVIAGYKKATADDTTGRAMNAASAKAAKANDALLKQYFNDFYEISATTSKQNSAVIVLKVAEKDLTKAEKKALEPKYAALIKNVGTPYVETFAIDKVQANVYLNGGVYDYEVEFTKAPAGVTKFKAKKGKLAKNKTISVKAVANDGNEIRYKLVNANSKIKINKTTGKITVKKGLKKGTYTFKVKAYVPGVRQVNNASTVTGWYEYQTIKVKIK